MTRTALPPSLALDELPRGKDMVAALTEALERQIRSDRLAPGDRLPSETAIAAAGKVSRGVVREAIAALKAAGLIETRQGSGAYVRVLPPFETPFRLAEPPAVDDLLAMLELRLAVEVEAATLAAKRRSAAQLDRLSASIAALDDARMAGEDGAEADLDFHRTIAGATGNRYFSHVMEQLGELALPRRRLSRDAVDPVKVSGYLELVQREHVLIRDAIAQQDPTLAAAAMRHHLAGSRRRYAALAGRKKG